jgi:hypothetical protein
VSSSHALSATQALELVQAGLAGLAACDIDSYGPAGLGEECAQILDAVGALQVQAARRLARFDALGGPAGEHAHSLAGWLGHRCRLRPSEARQLATTATRLHLLDPAVTALQAGQIGYGDLATIAEGIDKAADTMTAQWNPEKIAVTAQPILLEAASKVTPGQLRKAATRIALTLDGAGGEQRRAQIDRQSYLDLGQTIDGVGVLRAHMGAADVAIVEKTIDAFAPLPDPDQPTWANRAGHRRLRGLVTACQIALRSAAKQGYRDRGGAPLRVHIIATTPTLDPSVPAIQAPQGRTEYGTIITAAGLREMIHRHPTQITTIGIDAQGHVTDQVTADGQPLNWGRTRRLFTPAQRQVYLALYAGCAAEGCDRPPAWTDIDHKYPWIDGGTTDLHNGQPLCRWHNLHKEHQRRRSTSGTRRTDGQGREPPDPDH